MKDNGDLISGHEMGITCPISAEQVPWVHDTQFISTQSMYPCRRLRTGVSRPLVSAKCLSNIPPSGSLGHGGCQLDRQNRHTFE
jgi:hypothetical protein